MYTYGWLMFMYDRNQYNIVKQLPTKVSTLTNTHKLCMVLGEVKGQCYYTVIERRGAQVSLSQCCKELFTCVNFLDAQRQALVLKLKTSRTQESSQLLLDIFFFRNEGKFSHFWAILLCQLYKIACNFINISKRWSFVNI